MSEESRIPFETQPAALETAPAPLGIRPPREVSLFWRTFFLLAMLLLGCIIAWLQTFRALEFEPRALQSAQQLASLVNLTRAGLIHADSIARVSLVKTLADEEKVRIAPREPQVLYKLAQVRLAQGDDAVCRQGGPRKYPHPVSDSQRLGGHLVFTILIEPGGIVGVFRLHDQCIPM